MGVTWRRRELYLCNASKQPSEHYISHNMFDMLVFVMVLCASAKMFCILVCQRLLAILCCKKKTTGYDESDMRYTCAEKMRIKNSRERPGSCFSCHELFTDKKLEFRRVSKPFVLRQLRHLKKATGLDSCSIVEN